jgi:signal transduction histidine kinase
MRHHSPKPVPLRIEAGLYRIAQEALANVRKHANATRVEIDLRATSQDVRLCIRDDGVGFNPDREATGGQGLLGMRERVKLLDGRLRLVSQPGRGTRVSVWIPLQGEDEEG